MHGTKYAYVIKRCRCGACTAANTARARERRARRRAELAAAGLWAPRVRTHGIRATYNSGCRCDECRRSATDYAREYRHRAGVS